MSIFQTYLMGLIVVHLIWFFFFTTGQLLRRSASDESTWSSLAHFVITSVAGMALTGFGLLLLGFTHLLNRPGIAGALLLEGGLFWVLKNENCLSWTFWRTTLVRFIKPWSASTLFVYLVFLVLGVPAVLPPTFADSVSYHLAYAVDWANAGQIYVDPFLRFPYYANNFLLLYSALFILKLGSYCHFLTWLCGLLTCLGVQAFFTPPQKRSQEQLDRKQFYPERFLIPLCVAFSPVFLRYLNVAFIDVPIGLFILTPILCAYRSSSRLPFERELVVTAAFCAGMKLTLIGHLPFFLVSLFFAAAWRLRRREIALLSLVLVGLSLPWYMRNFIEARDPTPPIFNFYFKQSNPIFTQADAAIYSSDTITERQPLQLLLLPFRFFTNPESRNFREWGVSVMILLLYVLFLIAQLCLRHRQRPPERLVYLSAAVVYLAFPWLFSSLGRYALHWYPTLAAWVGVVISHICTRREAVWGPRCQIWTTRFATAAFSCALIYPSPTEGCVRFYQHYYAGIVPLFRSRETLEAYSEKNLSGYLASQVVIKTLTLNQKKNSRVLALRAEYLAFYFRKAKVISVGDYFGPARYRGLFEEVRQGNCLPYLNRLDISSVIVDPSASRDWYGFYEKFRAQLKEDRFVEYLCREDQVPVFLRSDIKPVPELTQVMP
ncbi:MAG: hypothetical protein DMG88_24135 [Acidobacteria bacterium]|nr:MAG: hypothetical protein DMG88_24135 [Acidobacteriota bacterium]